MNIVFWILVIIFLVAIWFSLSSVFKNVGMYFINIFKDTEDSITDDNDEE